LVPQHFDEVKKFREAMIEKTRAAVHERLSSEINYWDHRASQLKLQEEAGKVNARINSEKARARADDLEARLQKRTEELKQERQISALPPIAVGGAMVVPIVWLQTLKPEQPQETPAEAEARQRIEQLAMEAVMRREQERGWEPKDVSALKIGYDIESHNPQDGSILFIEVKGRAAGARTVTISKNEILTALNKPEQSIIAIVEVDGDRAAEPLYLRKPFLKEPDFAVTTITYDLDDLIGQAEIVPQTPQGEARRVSSPPSARN